MPFSDHSAVLLKCPIPKPLPRGPGRRKCNVSIWSDDTLSLLLGTSGHLGICIRVPLILCSPGGTVARRNLRVLSLVIAHVKLVYPSNAAHC